MVDNFLYNTISQYYSYSMHRTLNVSDIKSKFDISKYLFHEMKQHTKLKKNN